MRTKNITLIACIMAVLCLSACGSEKESEVVIVDRNESQDIQGYVNKDVNNLVNSIETSSSEASEALDSGNRQSEFYGVYTGGQFKVAGGEGSKNIDVDNLEEPPNIVGGVIGDKDNNGIPDDQDLIYYQEFKSWLNDFQYDDDYIEQWESDLWYEINSLNSEREGFELWMDAYDKKLS